jgi:hypothetical protein
MISVAYAALPVALQDFPPNVPGAAICEFESCLAGNQVASADMIPKPDTLSVDVACVQDFPPKLPGAAVCEFESCLAGYLGALQLPGLWAGDVARLVAAADFSAARAALLPSIPGYHAGGCGAVSCCHLCFLFTLCVGCVCRCCCPEEQSRLHVAAWAVGW